MPVLAAALPFGGLAVRIFIIGTVALGAGKIAAIVIKKANKVLELEV